MFYARSYDLHIIIFEHVNLFSLFTSSFSYNDHKRSMKNMLTQNVHEVRIQTSTLEKNPQ